METSAFFPTGTLSSEGGVQASGIGNLFASSATLRSLGASLAQTLFDAGARRARVAQARAAYDVAVAAYRQTVLVAFQDVEDKLTASQILARQEALLRDAVTAFSWAEADTQNQYEAGLITCTDVVTAQATHSTRAGMRCRPRLTGKPRPWLSLSRWGARSRRS